MVNFCGGFASFLSFVALVLLVFGSIGQIDSSLIPRHIRLVSLSVENLQASIAEQLHTGRSNITDLYASAKEGGNASVYVVRGVHKEGEGDGLRKVYEWGMWNFCTTLSTTGSSRSYCTPTSFGFAFQPASALLGDVPSKYVGAVKAVLPDSVGDADSALGGFSRGACYLIFFGSLLVSLTLLLSLLVPSRPVLPLLLSLLSTLILCIGLVIYTVLFTRLIAAINDVQSADEGAVDLGLDVQLGNAVLMMWAAAGLMLTSTVPFAIACCTSRSSHKKSFSPASSSSSPSYHQSPSQSRPGSMSSSKGGAAPSFMSQSSSQSTRVGSMRKSVDGRSSLPK